MPLLLHQVFQSAVQWAASPFHRRPVCHHCQRFAPLFFPYGVFLLVLCFRGLRHSTRDDSTHVSVATRSAVCCVLHLGGGPDAHRWPLSQPRHVPSAIAVDSRLIPQDSKDVSPVPLASLIVLIEGVSVSVGASPSSDLNLLYSGNLWDYLGETQKRHSSVTTRDDLRERDVTWDKMLSLIHI